MTTLEAISIIESDRELTSTDDVDEHLEAMQHLIDTGVVWHLQGSYQRLAVDMLNEGIASYPVN